MRAATTVIALLAVVVLMSASRPAAAQTTPFPTNGTSAGQVLPGDDGAVAMRSSPLQSLFSALTGYGSLASRASAWMPEAKAPSSARSYAAAHTPRYAIVRRAAYGRTSR